MVAAVAASGGGEDGNRDSNVLEQMMEPVEVVLQSIGEDVQREGLRKTPLRVASAFQRALAGYQLSALEIIGPVLFTEVGAGGGSGRRGVSGGIVVVSNIDSFTLPNDAGFLLRPGLFVHRDGREEIVHDLQQFPGPCCSLN